MRCSQPEPPLENTPRHVPDPRLPAAPSRGLGFGDGFVAEGRYSDCEKLILVCGILNIHTSGAFYEAFEPSRA